MKAALAKAIAAAEAHVKDARTGLPEELFLFLSRLTPMVNVDLLIKDRRGRTLLTWRDDRYWGPGWHIPGGIIRFKETAAKRLRAVAKAELGAEVAFGPAPEAVTEFVIPKRDTRGHFISLLYRCRLKKGPAPALEYKGGAPAHGQWAWHAGCPKDLLSVHKVYRTHIKRK